MKKFSRYRTLSVNGKLMYGETEDELENNPLANHRQQLTVNTGLSDAEGNEIYTADILCWADGRNEDEYTVLNPMDDAGDFVTDEPFYIVRYKDPRRAFDDDYDPEELETEELPKMLTKRNSVKYIISSTRYGTLNEE